MSEKRTSHRVLIMGAAGRDFHDFLTVYAQDPTSEVVAFTATQIPGIEDRQFPAAVAGERYPNGVPIYAESELVRLIAELCVDEVVFAYSDVPHEVLMHTASRVLASGADFRILGPSRTMVAAGRPVLSVCATRTGAGKSGISRRVFERLRARGLRAVAVRHPMPYRDLAAMRCERYASLEDLDALGATLEEREEYEPLIEAGAVVMAGVDYEAIARAAAAEADVIVWDGGNNDWPFYRSDLEIVAVDPHRLGHETAFFPGEVNLLRAEVVVITKANTAPEGAVAELERSVRLHNPDARVVTVDLEMFSDHATPLDGKRVLAVDDGPTLTHGGMRYGAAALYARERGATLVDPRPHAFGSLADTFARYPHLNSDLPAMGYSPEQLHDLERTIADSGADVVAVGTPIDLARLIEIRQQTVRVRYRAIDRSTDTIDAVVDDFIAAQGLD